MTRDQDVDTVARTVWAEARGEDDKSTPKHDGMEAVAAVIMNRARAALDYIAAKPGPRRRRHPLFGDGTPASVCLARWQFSCWNESDPNLPKLRSVGDDDRAFAQALEIAERAVKGLLADPTHGATHYHTTGVNPPWSRGLEPCATIGHHRFFNNVK
jgi:spore germination cell wall hydrolase CwlJ-like protein